ncbi:stage III sporulation protein AA [Lachnospiraceae bacterium LCP25S3_G4]
MDQLIQILPKTVRIMLLKEHLDYSKLQEIRLRVSKPVALLYDGMEMILTDEKKVRHVITKEEMKEAIEYVSNYSLYAFDNEMRQGFITIEGGHRVGMVGKTILEDNKIKNMKFISSMNVRVAHEVVGCAEKILPFVTDNKQIHHTMIISPPGCGKTTLLRDLIRLISDGNEWVKGCTVGVVDERSEIGGCYMGIAQNHLGMRTDILDCCPKAEGMIMLIRSMAPQVIAVDELGAMEDVHAVEYAMHCGCKMLATVHGESMDELRKKPIFEALIKQRRFERYVVLGNAKRVGEVKEIYNERGSVLCSNL